MSMTLETPCLRCDGSGELECCECNQSRDCPDCDGFGYLESDVAGWTIPERHKNRDELLALQADADKCHTDHAKLCELNPRAKESYDAQLNAALGQINEQAKALLA